MQKNTIYILLSLVLRGVLIKFGRCSIGDVLPTPQWWVCDGWHCRALYDTTKPFLSIQHVFLICPSCWAGLLDNLGPPGLKIKKKPFVPLCSPIVKEMSRPLRGGSKCNTTTFDMRVPTPSLGNPPSNLPSCAGKFVLANCLGGV